VSSMPAEFTMLAVPTIFAVSTIPCIPLSIMLAVSTTYYACWCSQCIHHDCYLQHTMLAVPTFITVSTMLVVSTMLATVSTIFAVVSNRRRFGHVNVVCSH
jgi:hypothetical protein